MADADHDNKFADSVEGLEGWSVPGELLDLARRVGVQVVFDVGSRDGLDGRFLASQLAARQLHAFEPVPESAAICRRNLGNKQLPFETFVNQTALSDRIGDVPFFPVNTAETISPVPGGNPGASSMFRFNDEYPFERIVQDETTLRSTTLDDYCRTAAIPDLLWIDAQGAELLILKGAQAVLPGIKIIFTEVCFKPIYHGQALFWDIDGFLRDHGFRRVKIHFGTVGTKKKIKRWITLRRWAQHMPGRFWSKTPWYSEALYINESILTKELAASIREID